MKLHGAAGVRRKSNAYMADNMQNEEVYCRRKGLYFAGAAGAPWKGMTGVAAVRRSRGTVQ